MRTYALILVNLLFLACSSFCFPSYVIELESGSELIVDHHWKDEGKIAFYFHGGIVAIPSYLVRSIRESDLPSAQENSSLGPGDETQEVEGQSEMTSSKTRERQPHQSMVTTGAQPAAGENSKETGFEYYKKQRLLLKSELQDATRRFREASSNKDPKAKQEAIQDMTQISQKLYRLAKELEEKNMGVLPDWWE
jgi:hypothetical protein